MPWTAISTIQMRKFIDHALSNEKLPFRTQAEVNLEAAIFCTMSGEQKAAKMYADKALEIEPTLRRDVEDLLPGM